MDNESDNPLLFIRQTVKFIVVLDIIRKIIVFGVVIILIIEVITLATNRICFVGVDIVIIYIIMIIVIGTIVIINWVGDGMLKRFEMIRILMR